mgnify:FL=1
MNSQRGNISLVLLVIGLFLVAVAQLARVYVQRNVQLEEEVWRGRQLRLLCSSVMEALAKKELATGEATFLESSLYPGNISATVTTKVALSNDGIFRYLAIKAQTTDLAQNLRNVEFQLQGNALQLAQQYMLISGKEVLGTEYLADEGIYTSKEEVTIPQLDFLKNTTDSKRSVAALGMEDVKLYGLDRRFYYLTNASTPLTFTKGLKVYGTAVIASEGSIVIEADCQFFDKVILLSKGNITIKDGVKLPQALLMAYGKVSIGSGCKIGGVIFSGSNIELLGSSELTHDAEVVARFSSAHFIL